MLGEMRLSRSVHCQRLPASLQLDAFRELKLLQNQFVPGLRHRLAAETASSSSFAQRPGPH